MNHEEDTLNTNDKNSKKVHQDISLDVKRDFKIMILLLVVMSIIGFILKSIPIR
jgi:hypothetical protein